MFMEYLLGMGTGHTLAWFTYPESLGTGRWSHFTAEETEA